MASHRPDTQALRDWDVLVTRPAGLADTLCAALEHAGARTHRAPLLKIEALPETAADRALAQDLDRFEFVIVTSRHAVQHGLTRLAAYWPQWPVDIRWLAVGAATAGALAAQGIDADAPVDARSEGLLELPALHDVRNRRLLLLTGEGGRGLLESVLAERGARVSRLATYRRAADAAARPAVDAFRSLDTPHRAVLVTSRDALQNLLALAPGLPTQQVLLIAASARIADAARAAGLSQVVTATGADDDALLTALLRAATTSVPSPREDRA